MDDIIISIANDWFEEDIVFSTIPISLKWFPN